MKIKLTAAFKSVPRTLLLPLKDTGFFERFTGLQVNEQSGLDAILPAPSSDEALAMFAINMAHFWSE